MTTSEELNQRADEFRLVVDRHLPPLNRPSFIKTISMEFFVVGNEVMWGGVWRQPGLSDRLRAVATITAQCVNGRDFGLQHQIRAGLNLGLTPQKIKAMFAELEFYLGVPDSVYGIRMAQEVINEREEWMDADQRLEAEWLPTVEEKLDRGRELRRAAWGSRADEELANSLTHRYVEGSAQIVDGYLYGELWARSPLEDEERMVMILAALACRHHLRQLRAHVGYALDAGLDKQQICQVLAQAAWYRGWPFVEDALYEADAVFQERGL